MKKYSGTEIAIIGIACKFPGAKNYSEYWNNLKNGIESIKSFSDQEIIEELGESKILDNPNYVKANSFLEGKEYFDAEFFGYLKAEAELMDPQARLFHEICWKAIEDAGYNINNYKEKIGLFAGGTNNPNWIAYANVKKTENNIDPFSNILLSDLNFLCSKISYLFNLTGPSINLNTACSTSLVAVQRATMSLLLRECNMALAGGVTIKNFSNRGYFYKEGTITSKDGHCRAFDEDASGTVMGEGLGVIVLKRLADAIKDNDNIYGIIKGSGINNDGANKMTYAAPSIEGQAIAIKKAIDMSGVSSESISYIEAHGTGTNLGDPIEIQALVNAFDKTSEKHCAIGSVKTNIGHLDSAAGIAGLIKAVLCLKHKTIPPSLNYNKPNPKINFKDSPFYVNTELRKWQSDRYPLRAGVSSFGIGGTNAHIILEEAEQNITHSDNRDEKLVLISGKTSSALKRNISNLKKFLTENENTNLADLAYTLQVGRVSFPYRQMITCNNTSEAIKKLSEIEEQAAVFNGEKELPLITFMFPGQGSQYLDMCYYLYNNEEYFRETLNKCFKIFEGFTGKYLKNIIFQGDSVDDNCLINETEYTQPALFVIEYALAQLMKYFGVNPNILIGHSIGEYVAACLSGVFSLEDAIKLVVKRAALMQRVSKGIMLRVSLSYDRIKHFVNDNKSVSLAAINSTDLCLLAGKVEDINELKESLDKKDIKCSIIRTSHAFHSYMMDEIMEEFEEVVSKVHIGSPTIPIISNVTGKDISEQEIKKPEYWSKHLRQTVMFSQGISTIMNNKNMLFLEIGPGNTLGTFVNLNNLKGDGHKVVRFVKHPNERGNDHIYLMKGLGKLWQFGIELNWENFYKNEKRRRISLPTYSFEKNSFPVNIDIDSILRKQVDKEENNFTYIPTWKLAIENSLRSDNFENCLVFYQENSLLGHKILKSLVDAQKKVIKVRTGEHFKRISSDSYVINPSAIEDYQELFDNLKKDNLYTHKIIHCLGVSEFDSADTEKSSLEAMNQYFFSIFNIIKIAEKTDLKIIKELVVLTSGLHNIVDANEISPLKSLSIPLLKVITQEYPSVSTKHIDVSIDEIEKEGDFKVILNEILKISEQKEITIRNSKRWVKVYDQINQKSANIFKKSGNYLITGGLGNFGYGLAKYLVKEYDARVLLLGKTKMPDKNEWDACLENNNAVSDKVIKLKDLEEISNKVSYKSCNIASSKEFSQVVDDFNNEYSKFDGVIHAAGVISGESLDFISKLEGKHFEEQFESKIKGTVVLSERFKNENLDFCLFISSISTILGGMRLAAYASANVFIDYFVELVKNKYNIENWTSINLDSLKLSNKENHGVDEDVIREIAINVFPRCSYSQIVVSNTDIKEKVKPGKKDSEEILEDKGKQSVEELGVKIKSIVNTKQDQLNLELALLKYEVEGEGVKVVALIKSTNNNISNYKLRKVISREFPQESSSYNIVKVPDIPIDLEEKSDKELALNILKDHVRVNTNLLTGGENGIQQKLIKVWKNVLEIENVSLSDTFFDLGGDSLMLVRLNKSIQANFNVELPLNIFITNTFEAVTKELIKTLEPVKK